ncbi:hypothetical protein TCDM_04257 [Trypanosoma cruzi Dm28c]|uniref:Uncharacterized protein n=1 Tax=Trypanosoma cruzi Dm28c TaxID=1416333 RepID=V5BR73_TRYCR|nr:hypothetical protein TCDM_04257 [Trypanosoma cruzi Dm28c]
MTLCTLVREHIMSGVLGFLRSFFCTFMKPAFFIKADAAYFLPWMTNTSFLILGSLPPSPGGSKMYSFPSASPSAVSSDLSLFSSSSSYSSSSLDSSSYSSSSSKPSSSFSLSSSPTASSSSSFCNPVKMTFVLPVSHSKASSTGSCRVPSACFTTVETLALPKLTSFACCPEKAPSTPHTHAASHENVNDAASWLSTKNASSAFVACCIFILQGSFTMGRDRRESQFTEIRKKEKGIFSSFHAPLPQAAIL